MPTRRFSSPWEGPARHRGIRLVSRILVVCTMNEARSPLVERLLDATLRRAGADCVTTSAGTHVLEPGKPMAPIARSLLSGAGIAAADFGSQRVTATMIASADLILTAETRHTRTVTELDPRAALRTHRILEYAEFGDSRSTPGARLDLVDPLGTPGPHEALLGERVRAAVSQIVDRICG